MAQRTAPSPVAPPARVRPPERGQAGPLRVLLVVDSLDGGGAERYVVDLAAALRRRGHDVHVAASAGGVLEDELRAAGVPLTLLGAGRVKRRVSRGYALALRDHLRALRPDVLHAHCYASATAARIALAGSDLPLVLTEHTEAPWRDDRALAASRRTYARAAAVLAVSTRIRDLLVDGFGVPADRVRHVPNAVLPAPPALAGPPAGLPPARTLVGRVSRLAPEKGVDVFLRAAARLAGAHPGVAFLVVGEGPLRAELEALAARLGLAGAVRFLGFRSDARAVIAALDVMAVTSRHDGAPLVALEAMGAGVPVVGSGVGGIPDLVRHEREGLLVAPDDEVALAEALGALLSDPARARALGRAGRRRAAGLTHRRLVDAVEATYRAALPATASQSLWRTGVV